MPLVVTMEQSRSQQEFNARTLVERRSFAEEIAQSQKNLKPRSKASVGSEYEDRDVERLRQSLIMWADRMHAVYPQYKGHWNDWQLARVKADLTSKGGNHARKGDIVLVNPKCEIVTSLRCGPRICVVIWDLRTGGDHQTLADNLELL